MPRRTDVTKAILRSKGFKAPKPAETHGENDLVLTNSSGPLLRRVNGGYVPVEKAAR